MVIENEEENKEVEKKRKSLLKGILNNVILLLFTVLVAIPVFLIIYQYVPQIWLGSFRVDKIVTFIPIFILLFFIAKQLKLLVYIMAVCLMGYITVSSFMGGYNIHDLFLSYNSMLFNIKEGAVKINFLEEKKEFTNAEKMVQAIDYNSEEVRTMAVHFAADNFKDYVNTSPGRKVIHSLSIFKELYNRWYYVHDPAFEDYYAKASETAKHLDYEDEEKAQFKGDCDDYSILMAACVKAVGGEVRLVRTTVKYEDGTEVGHIYPEVKIGDEKDLEKLTYLIKNKLFVKESKGKEIFYYLDYEGYVWLNFDYNDAYPGAKYQSEIRESVIDV